MPTILTDIAVQRQVLLERLKASEVRKFTKTLSDLDKYIRDQLSGTRLTDFRRSRLEAQLAGMRQVMVGQYDEYIAGLNSTLEGLATASGNFEANTLKAYAPSGLGIALPAPGQAWAAATVNPLVMNGANGAPLLDSFMKDWRTGDADMVTNAIRQGYLLGETNGQIISRIRGTAAARFSDGVLAKSRHHAETVTRTAVQHVANQARAAAWEANSDIIEEYQWVSTLDSRTTPICRDRDLQKFAVGKGPLPPAHPNCRSTTVAVIGGEFGRLLDEDATRASVDGPVPAGESYYDWLKRQDPEFQDIALGPTRGQLFREGGLSVEEFGRLQLNKNFEPMTLEQMRQVNPEAFRKAGLGETAPIAPAQRPFAPLSLDEISELEDNFEFVIGNVSAAAESALLEYTGAAYHDINRVLRNPGLEIPLEYPRDRVLGWIKELDGAMRDGVVSADAMMYRGVNHQFLVDHLRARGKVYNGPEDLVGEVFEDSGFMSFSYLRGVATSFSGGLNSTTGLVMRMDVREGSKGWMSTAGVNEGEFEVVRLGGRFRIVAWDPEDGVLVIEPVP